MLTSRDAAFAFTMIEEGLLSLDPFDGGNFASGIAGLGPLIGSKYGVSAAVLIEYLAPLQVTAAVMAGITSVIAEAIWTPNRWQALRCDDLAAGLDLMVADHGYNRGLYASAKVLQRMCGAEVDGWLGADTIAAGNRWLATADHRDLSWTAIREIQVRLGQHPDGISGPKTNAAILASRSATVMLSLAALADAQLADYRTLAQFSRYGRAWSGRVWDRLGAGLALLPT